MNRLFRSLSTAFAFVVFSLVVPPAAAEEGSATIEEGKLVSVSYVLSVDGEVIESNEGKPPLVYTQGGDEILIALETALEGLHVGDEKTVELTAAEGYGEIRDDAFQEVPLDMIPEGARQVGAMLQSPEFPGPIRVAEVRDESIILDFNHPLAGKALQFDVTVLSIDDAPEVPEPPSVAPVE